MKLLFSFLLTVASLSAFAQQTIKISGRVTDFNDKPISNCTVMLMAKEKVTKAIEVL